MRNLLDECIDCRLAKELTGHDVRTVQQVGWGGLKNGDLLSRAEKDFDVFITVDRNLPYQQHLPRFYLAVIILSARSNRLADLRPLVPQILSSIQSAKKGQSMTIGL